MLVSFDQQRTEADPLASDGDWMPAGRDWSQARTADVEGLGTVVLSAAEPQALARRWSELMGRPLDPANPLRLPLDRGEIRFVAGGEGAPTLIEALDIVVSDPDAVMERARDAGLDANGDGVRIGGVLMRPAQGRG
jgi:hypothetical protein